MRTGRMDRSGEGLTKAGHILGVIGTILFGIELLLVGLWTVLLLLSGTAAAPYIYTIF